MKTIRQITLTALLTAGLAGGFLTASAAPTNAAGTSVKGKVTSVDASAQTLEINGQEFQILPTTRITASKKAATINDVEAGEQITASYKQSADNKRELLSVDMTGSAAGGAGDAATSESGASFSGKVAKVNPTAKTLTVGNQTYQVLPTTKILRNDEQASFEDITAGKQLSGQYKKSAENKFEVLSLELPEAVGGSKDRPTSQTGASFSGKVAKIDPVAQTLTIGSRTFQLLPTSTLTTANGKTTTLAGVKANQQVTGTYKQSADNKLEVLSLQVSGKSQ